jgi:hypothetical protein
VCHIRRESWVERLDSQTEMAQRRARERCVHGAGAPIAAPRAGTSRRSLCR